MARKKLVETKIKNEELSKLSKLIESWGSNKAVMDSYKKPVTNDAAEIKQIMMKHKLVDSSSGKYTAHLTIKTSESMDEDALLQYIQTVIWADKGSMHCPYIKTVPVIDWEALEKAMYNGDITKEQILEMDKFKIVTQTPELRLKIAKED